MVAPNGARKTRQDHAAIPLTPDALAETAVACLDAGACAIHLHVRDDNGGHSLAPERYRSAIDAIRGAVGNDLLIQVTTEAVGLYSAEEQIEVVRELIPEAVSLSVRELGRAGEDAVHEFDRWLSDNHVLPQWILYSVDDQSILQKWMERDVLSGSAYPVLFVLGKYNPPVAATTDMLNGFLKHQETPDWMVCAFGDNETHVLAEAVSRGGHARIGFENNFVNQKGELARDNASRIVELIAAVRHVSDRTAATAAEARKLMMPRW